MNWPSWLLSGFLATLALSTILSLSQGLGLTRINLPYLIGTFFTPWREKARVYGFIVHLLNGWIFSILYVLVFENEHMANWWFGAILGLAQALFVLTVGMALMPGLHPRMASEQHGPNANRQLNPQDSWRFIMDIRRRPQSFLRTRCSGQSWGRFII